MADVREARPASVALLTAAVGHAGDGAVGSNGDGNDGGDDVGAGGALAAALDASVADAPPAERDDLVLAALRAVLPVTAERLRAAGMTETDVAASLADVDRKVARYGLRGTGTDWLCAVATGRVVAVGRLQFERGVHLPDGTPTWSVHVPETGPLDPVACDRAFADGPDLLRRLAPDHVATSWSCRSWLLDPGLAAALGPDANVVRFARRFRLLPPGPHDATEGDDSIAKFVFGTGLVAARAARPSGRVQRAVHDRWGDGGHWTERTGVADIGAVRSGGTERTQER